MGESDCVVQGGWRVGESDGVVQGGWGVGESDGVVKREAGEGMRTEGGRDGAQERAWALV